MARVIGFAGGAFISFETDDEEEGGETYENIVQTPLDSMVKKMSFTLLDMTRDV